MRRVALRVGALVAIAGLRRTAVETVDDTEKRCVQHHCRREVRVGAAARHAVLDSGSGTAFVRDAVGAAAVVEAPVRPVAGDDARDQPLVAVDGRRGHRRQAFMVGNQPTEALPGERRQAVFGTSFVERVGATADGHEREVDVQPAAHHRRIGATHVGDAVALARGELASHLLADERTVGRIHCRAVLHVQLHLAGMELAHDALQVELAVLGRVEQIEHQTSRVAAGTHAVNPVRRDVQRAETAGRVGVGLQDVELHLEAQQRLVPERTPGVDRSLQRVARPDGQWLSIELEVGDDDVGIDLPTVATCFHQWHRGQVREADIGRIPRHGQDVAIDVHRQRGDGVVAMLVQSARRHVAPMRQPVEIAPHDSYSSVPHSAATLAKAMEPIVRPRSTFGPVCRGRPRRSFVS